MAYKAYTLNLGHNPQDAVSDIYVSKPIGAGVLLLPDSAIKCRGKWDTGCNMTCITEDLATQLNLPRCRPMEIKTPHGTTSYTTTVVVALKLPNGQIRQSVEVCVAKMVDADMLIGMDLITQGDFALSRNQYGEVIMSICMPPLMSIDLKPIADEVNKGPVE